MEMGKFTLVCSCKDDAGHEPLEHIYSHARVFSFFSLLYHIL
jgi:hypothetical protein